MKRALLPTLFLLFALGAVGQPNGLFAWEPVGLENNYDTMKSSFSINGRLNFGSNCLTAQFANYFIGKMFIDSTMKQDVQSSLVGKNRYGYDLDEGITYSHKIKSLLGLPVSGYYLALRNRTHADAFFTGDAFNLVFNGNSMFAGKTATLDNINVHSMQYQQLQFGLVKVYPAYKSSYTVGFGLSLLKGQDDLQITTGKTGLFTQNTGDTITLDLSMRMNQSDIAKTGYSAFNGWGLSTDIFVEYYDTTSEVRIRLDVKDLGFIMWNNHSIQNNIDTSFNFTGFNVANLLYPSDSLSNLSLDSSFVKTYNAHQTKKTYNTILPASVNLSYRMFISDNHQYPLDAGINYRFAANYNFMVYAGISDFINKKTIIGGTFTYGGYSKYGLGINFGKDFGKGCILAIQTQNIESLLFPNGATGEGAMITFKKFF